MQPTIKKLLIILDEEAAGYQDMNKILADEEVVISLSGKERFDQAQHKKDALVLKLQAIEEKRKLLVDRLSDEYETGVKPMTVRQLVKYVNPPYDDKLLVRANRLRLIIAEVQENNRRNQMLINHYLGLIKESLKLLTNLIEDNSVYQKPGTHKPAVGYQSGGGRLICGTV